MASRSPAHHVQRHHGLSTNFVTSTRTTTGFFNHAFDRFGGLKTKSRLTRFPSHQSRIGTIGPRTFRAASMAAGHALTLGFDLFAIMAEGHRRGHAREHVILTAGAGDRHRR